MMMVTSHLYLMKGCATAKYLQDFPLIRFLFVLALISSLGDVFRKHFISNQNWCQSMSSQNATQSVGNKCKRNKISSKIISPFLKAAKLLSPLFSVYRGSLYFWSLGLDNELFLQELCNELLVQELVWLSPLFVEQSSQMWNVKSHVLYYKVWHLNIKFIWDFTMMMTSR